MAISVLGVRYVLVVQAERDRAVAAEMAAADALGVSSAVNAYMKAVIGAANPREHGKEVTVAEALAFAEERIGLDLAGQPRVEAGVRGMIGSTYLGLGRLEEAEGQLTLALELAEEHFGAGTPETLDLLHSLATLRQDQGDLAAGERLLERVIAGRLALLGPDHEKTLSAQADLGRLYVKLERFDEAEALLTDVVAHLQHARGSDDPDVLIARKDLATVALLTGRIDLAKSELRQVLEAQERTLGQEHPDTLVTMSDLASVLRRGDASEQAEAIELFKEALAGFAARQEPGHMDRVIVAFNLANTLRKAGRPDEALGYARTALEEGELGLGSEHYITLLSGAQVGGLLAETGDVVHGREALLEARERIVEVFGEGHTYVNYVDLQLDQLDQDESSKSDEP